jgi:serine/threonine protein kinase
MKGSFTYLSPELLRRDFQREKPTGDELLNSDIWAMGLVLLKLLTRNDPTWFHAGGAIAMREQLVGHADESIKNCRDMLKKAFVRVEYAWIARVTMTILKLGTRPTAAELHALFQQRRYGPDVK